MTDTDTKLDTIEEAKAPGVFSLDNLISGIAYPEETVTVFTDARSVNELIHLRDKRAKLEDKLAKQRTAKKPVQRTVSEPVAEVNKDIEEINNLIDALDAKIAQSGIKLKFRGISPAALDELSKKYFTEPDKDYTGTEEMANRDYDLIATTLVEIADVNGTVDPAPITVDTIKKLKSALLAGEYLRIVHAAARASMNAALFDQAVDAPFLSGRADLAG